MFEWSAFASKLLNNFLWSRSPPASGSAQNRKGAGSSIQPRGQQEPSQPGAGQAQHGVAILPWPPALPIIEALDARSRERRWPERGGRRRPEQPLKPERELCK